LEYKVRYVRNITDVGHIVDDADDGGQNCKKSTIGAAGTHGGTTVHIDFHEILKL
jgi:cysteinyl-tRNA synthetase